MASLDLDDLPPKIARVILGLSDGEALLVVNQGAVMGRLIAQTSPMPAPAPAPDTEPPPAAAAPPEVPKVMRSPVPKAEPAKPAPAEPAPPISSPAVEQKTRDIFEQFRSAIEDEF